jgi:hypothetical protein
VELAYLDAGVRVTGRVVPSLAGELRAAAARGRATGALPDA